MTKRRNASWYSVTLNLGRVTEVIPAAPSVAVQDRAAAIVPPTDEGTVAEGHNVPSWDH